MELLTLRDQVYHRIQQNCLEDTALVPLATPAAQQALRAWKRRLRSVGEVVTMLTPPSGALEWASPASTTELSDRA
jgi:hypothetical protein